ncbi:MAG: hypothetical protein ABI330_21030 [Caldimonas sp.]
MRIQDKPLISAIVGAACWALAATAGAAEYHLVKTIQVPGHPIAVVDFSTLDQENGEMYVSDRSNRSIDVFDTNTDTYVRRFGGFRGVYNQVETSGPNIGIREGDVIWVSDSPSNVKALEIESGKILDTIDCGGGNFRIDGAALDPKDHILMAESADTAVPYLCWINTKTRKLIGKSEPLHEATAGLEGSTWDERTDTFYLAVPEIEHGPGAIYQINPTTRAVIKKYMLPPGDACEAGGISLNKEQDEILIGCDGKDYTDILNLKDGSVTQTGFLGGTDQTAYDPVRHKYFLGSRRGSKGSVLGVIDALTHKLEGFPQTAKKSHAVAVNHRTGEVFVPMGPNADPFDNDPGKGLACTHGCIGVFAP